MASVVWWLVAAVLVAGGLCVVLWEKVLRRGPVGRWCRGCGYDMSGVPGLVCPECGRGARSERSLVRRKRRARRGMVVFAGVLIVSGVGVGAHAYVSRLHWGWWELAPNSVLISAVERPNAVAARALLYGRTGDSTSFVVRPETLSASQWRRLAGACGRVLRAENRSSKDRGWATWMLAVYVPDAACVDPVIRSVLRDAGCGGRGIMLIGAALYFDARGEFGAMWVDDLVAALTDPECDIDAVVPGATALARGEKLPRDVLLRAAAGLKGRAGREEVLRAITLGLARGEAPAWERAALLNEIAADGDATTLVLVGEAMAEIEQLYIEINEDFSPPVEDDEEPDE